MNVSDARTVLDQKRETDSEKHPPRQVSLQQGLAAQRPADLLPPVFFISANGASNLSSLIPLFLRVSLMEALEKRTPTESAYTMLFSYLICFSAALLLADRFPPTRAAACTHCDASRQLFFLGSRPSYTIY